MTALEAGADPRQQLPRDATYRSRKFFLACVSLGAGIVALFAGKMSDSAFVYLVIFILGLYGGLNLADKPDAPWKVNK